MFLDNYHIILASQSPRRKQLLAEAGFKNLDICPMNVDETPPPQYPVEKLAAYLATKKAMAAKPLLGTRGNVIVAADTTVVLDNVLYEKPLDIADARRILSALSGKTHKVITGVCILSDTQKRVFSEASKVEFDVLTPEEIDFYIENYQPFDKAGAYAVQDWIGHCKIKRIQGTYENIMGLPTFKVYKTLMNLEIKNFK